jgi:hypothetical protein
LLLQQRQAVSPKIKNKLQGKLESLAKKLPYGRTLKIGSCNAQGIKITDRQNLIKTMMVLAFRYYVLTGDPYPYQSLQHRTA